MFRKSLVFTATYNEYPNVRILLEKICNLKLALDILIIDDNSNDGTLAFLKQHLFLFMIMSIGKRNMSEESFKKSKLVFY